MGGGVFHRWQYLDELEDVQHPGELGRTVLGLPDKAIWQRLARTQSELVKARTAAQERDRPVPAYRELRIVGRSWGWLELQVYPSDEPELYGIVGVGVASPGSRPTAEMAESHHRRACRKSSPGWPAAPWWVMCAGRVLAGRPSTGGQLAAAH